MNTHLRRFLRTRLRVNYFKQALALAKGGLTVVFVASNQKDVEEHIAKLKEHSGYNDFTYRSATNTVESMFGNGRIIYINSEEPTIHIAERFEGIEVSMVVSTQTGAKAL